MKIKIKSLALNVFLFLLFIMIPAISFADQTVVVESYGENRNDALLHAKRDAVAQGIGSMLSSETEVENFILKKDLVITKTLGSVKRITILEEKKNFDYVKNNLKKQPM